MQTVHCLCMMVPRARVVRSVLLHAARTLYIRTSPNLTCVEVSSSLGRLHSVSRTSSEGLLVRRLAGRANPLVVSLPSFLFSARLCNSFVVFVHRAICRAAGKGCRCQILCRKASTRASRYASIEQHLCLVPMHLLDRPWQPNIHLLGFIFCAIK